MKPREYLQNEPPSGNATDYEDVLQHVSHYVEDRAVSDRQRDLLEPADHSIWDDNFDEKFKEVKFDKNLVSDCIWNHGSHGTGAPFIVVTPNKNVGLLKKMCPKSFTDTLWKLGALTPRQWEKYDNGRYFHISKAVTARLRHGWPAPRQR